MGAWDINAWDNDSAADWFADLFEKTQLAHYVETSLLSDPEDEPEVIRAAAYILLKMGKVYIWPIDDLKRHLLLAIEKLELVQQFYADDGQEDFIEAIQQEIDGLRANLPLGTTD